MERLMGKIIDVAEAQDALNRAARDAKHGPRDVRAGRFVHRDARDGRISGEMDKRATQPNRQNPVPDQKNKQAC